MEGMGNRGDSEAERVDVATTVALVARVVRDIDSSGEEQPYVLLTDLLCAAWPTERAQSQ